MNRSHLSQINPAIYLITGGNLSAENFSEKSTEILNLIKSAVEAKINLIQIREKKLTTKLVFELTAKAAKITQNTPTKLLVNDRADIALAANADGVHLTAASLSTQTIRQNFPSDFIIGVSSHSLSDAQFAKQQGADFVTFSPIYDTPSKEKYGAPQGVEKLKKVCEALKPFPVIALGGINETNFSETLKYGASGFAAIRFLNNPGNLRKLTAKLDE